MANIYTYTETVWTYHSTTRVSDESFEFDGIGAYAETTILGEDLGGLDNDLFLRGGITPSQGKLTQGLCCRLDFYAKQKAGQDYWDIENHLIYLKGDKNGQINQKLSLIGFQGYFDHMVLRIEVMPDAELGLGGTIELTDFVIDDVSLNVDLSPVMDAIEEQGEAAKLMSDLLGLMMGVYPSRVMQQDGSFIYYWHDQPLMAESNTIWRLDANVFAVSNDGGQTWTGQTSDGTVIAKMVYALQIQASQVILSDGSDIDETLGELSGHFGESGDFTILESGYAAFVKRVTGSDPPATGDYSTTTIDGGNIATGTVTASQIKANAVTASKLNVTAIDGSGELYSTGGTLKLSNIDGTVEISPSNPLKVTDYYGNFMGGVVKVGGDLILVSKALATSQSPSYVIGVGDIVRQGSIFGAGLRVYHASNPSASIVDVEMSGTTSDSSFEVHTQKALFYVSDTPMPWNFYYEASQPYSTNNLTLLGNHTYGWDIGCVINNRWAGAVITPSNSYLEADGAYIGVSSTSGPYFTHDNETVYFHNLVSTRWTLTGGNLNNVITPGAHTLSGSYSYTNAPSGMTNGTLLVLQSSTNFYVQVAWGNGTQSGAHRRSTDGGSSWTAWAK